MTYDPTFNHVDNKASLNYISNQLEYNLSEFLDYGFVSAGGFINVKASGDNIYGVAPYKLYPVNDPNYKNGQVWQTVRKNWVYESGIGGSAAYGSLGKTPVYITGIHVGGIGGTLVNDETAGTYSHDLDYKNGRVIFDSAISNTTNLVLNYSYKWVQVYNYADADFWQEIQYATDNNETHLNSRTKGDFTTDPKNRVQLPAVVLETVPRSSSTPHRIGDHSLVVDQDILIHIIADNYFERNNITDIIKLQEDRVIKMYDINTVSKSGVYTFKFDGQLNANRIGYKELVNNNDYFYNTCRLKDMVVSSVESVNPDLFESTIRTTAEIIVV